MAITFVTTTSYGTWVPGDLRGYVQDGIILPSNPRLLKAARSIMRGEPVLFSVEDREQLFGAALSAADEFGYRLTDLSIEPWHLHWIINHGDDTDATMVGRLKTRMRQALNRGRIWTESYWAEELRDEVALLQVRKYIANHSGCRLSDGKPFRR